MLDLTLLQLMKDREQYEALSPYIHGAGLDKKTEVLLKDFGRHFKDTGAQAIDASFWSVSFPAYHKKLDEDQLEVYRELGKKIAADPDAMLIDGIRARLLANRTSTHLIELVTAYEDGEEVDLLQELRGLVEKVDAAASVVTGESAVRPTTRELFKPGQEDIGLHWKLPCLERSMRALQGGDSVCIAARVDQGKTSFLLSEVCHWASQMDELFGKESSIRWYCNEGKAERIFQRAFNAALGKGNEQLWKLEEGGTLDAEFVKAVGGTDIYSRIQVVPCHDWTMAQIEDDLRKHPECKVVIYDMLANVTHSGGVLHNGERTDQIMEALAQRARILAVKNDQVCVFTWQLSGEADGELYPKMKNLSGSQTGVAGACDVVILMGHSNDPAMSSVRAFSLPKNKLHRGTGPKSPRKSALFLGPSCEFVEQDR